MVEESEESVAVLLETLLTLDCHFGFRNEKGNLAIEQVDRLSVFVEKMLLQAKAINRFNDLLQKLREPANYALEFIVKRIAEYLGVQIAHQVEEAPLLGAVERIIRRVEIRHEDAFEIAQCRLGNFTFAGFRIEVGYFVQVREDPDISRLASNIGPSLIDMHQRPVDDSIKDDLSSFPVEFGGPGFEDVNLARSAEMIPKHSGEVSLNRILREVKLHGLIDYIRNKVRPKLGTWLPTKRSARPKRVRQPKTSMADSAPMETKAIFHYPLLHTGPAKEKVMENQSGEIEMAISLLPT